MRLTIKTSFFVFFFFVGITSEQKVFGSLIQTHDIEITEGLFSFDIPLEKNAVPIKQVQPDLPEAILGRLTGKVWVNAFVDSLGDVNSVKIMKSDAKIFNEVVLAAAKQWKFSLAVMDGKPIGCWVTIQFKIGINEKKVDQQNQKEYKSVKPRTLLKPEKKYHKPKKKKRRIIQCGRCHGYFLR